MDKIIIYGTNLEAATLYKLITTEQQAEVVAFLIDHEYRKYNMFQNLPVYDSEELQERFSPEDYQICLSFGYKNMVHNREAFFNKCKNLGYKIYTFVSKNAIVYSDDIGEGCIIYPSTTIAPFVKIGKGTFLETGCIIAHHTQIGDFNFIAPGVHFCGDVKTGNNCFFGGASEIVNSCNIGDEVFVGAAAKVSRDLEMRSAVLPSSGRYLLDASFCMMEKMFR